MTGPLWVVQCILTDGLQPPRRAIKFEALWEDEPDIQRLKWLEAQVVGQYRIQYQEWSTAIAHARFRAQHEPDRWVTVGDLVRDNMETGARDVDS